MQNAENRKICGEEHAIPSGEDILKRFGLTVKKLRRSLGISQNELAEQAGLHRTYVSDVERGKRNTSLKIIGRLAEALNVPLSALFEPPGNQIEVNHLRETRPACELAKSPA